eukprot:scaffold7017_cov75-Phaeocystis_antarctica.AAC.2
MTEHGGGKQGTVHSQTCVLVCCVRSHRPHRTPPAAHPTRMRKRPSAEGPPASEEPASHKGRPYEPEREFKQQDAASSSGASSSGSVLEVDVSKASPDLVRRASMTILSSIGASRSKPLAALSAEEEQGLRTFYLHLMRWPGAHAAAAARLEPEEPA